MSLLFLFFGDIINQRHLMEKADSLILTKRFLPFTRTEQVSRSRLREKIPHGLCGPLTLLIAPAGFGKTTLLASYFACFKFPVAWIHVGRIGP